MLGLEGVTAMLTNVGAAGATPTPVSWIICGLFPALSVRVTVPVLVPATVGVKAIPTVELAPGAYGVFE